MSQLKVDEILDASGGSNAVLYGPASPAGSMGFRNRIINGDMRIDQRNAGASVTIPAYTDTYGMDRWKGYGQPDASQFSVQQVNATGNALAAGFTKCAQISSLVNRTQTSSDIFTFMQRIEAYNMADLQWGTANAKAVTLSFWVKSSKTGTHGGSILDSANAYCYPFSYSVTSANTWEYKTVNISGATSGTWLTTNGIGIQVGFELSVGSSFSGTAGSWTSAANTFGVTGAVNVLDNSANTWSITGVQLEVGSVATEFERRPYGTELSLCQRYYEKTYSLSVAPGTNSQPGLVDWSTASNGGGFCVINNRFSTAKRTAPTLKGWTEGGTANQWYMSRSGASGNQSVNLDIASEFGFRIYLSTGANWTVCRIEGHWTADAEL